MDNVIVMIYSPGKDTDASSLPPVLKPQNKLFLPPSLVFFFLIYCKICAFVWSCCVFVCFCCIKMTGGRCALRLDRLGLAGSAALCFFPPLR